MVQSKKIWDRSTIGCCKTLDLLHHTIYFPIFSLSRNLSFSHRDATPFRSSRTTRVNPYSFSSLLPVPSHRVDLFRIPEYFPTRCLKPLALFHPFLFAHLLVLHISLAMDSAQFLRHLFHPLHVNDVHVFQWDFSD